MASARASPAKAAHISPTNSKAPKARAQEQAQRSGSRGSGHRRSEAGARKRLHARCDRWSPARVDQDGQGEVMALSWVCTGLILQAGHDPAALSAGTS